MSYEKKKTEHIYNKLQLYAKHYIPLMCLPFITLKQKIYRQWKEKICGKVYGLSFFLFFFFLVSLHLIKSFIFFLSYIRKCVEMKPGHNGLFELIWYFCVDMIFFFDYSFISCTASVTVAYIQFIAMYCLNWHLVDSFFFAHLNHLRSLSFSYESILFLYNLLWLATRTHTHTTNYGLELDQRILLIQFQNR